MTTHVLVPGLLSDARVWRHLGRALDSAHPMIHADVTRDTSIGAMAARLLSQSDDDLIIAGHSMGGRVAMEAARQAPARVRGLVLSNTGHNSKREGEDHAREARVELGHTSIARLAAEWLPPMIDPVRLSDSDLMTDLTDMVVAVGAEAHARQIRALLNRPDAGRYLPHIACPILFMTGANDSWSPEAQHLEMVTMAARGELHVIDDAGHFLPVEQPEEVVRIVGDWLRRHSTDLYDRPARG